MSETDNMLAYGECFRCKGLAVVDKRYWESLPGLLYRAANSLSTISRGDHEDVDKIVTDLKAYAIYLEMIPDE